MIKVGVKWLQLIGQTGAKCHTTSRLRGIRATDCACLCLVVNTIAVVVSLLDRHKTGSCFVQIGGDNKTTLYARDTYRTNSTLSIPGIYVQKIYTKKTRYSTKIKASVISLLTKLPAIILKITSFFHHCLKIKSDYISDQIYKKTVSFFR